jgi:transposase-like protein
MFRHPEFKVKVAVDTIRGLKTSSELASHYQIHPVQISQWKKQALDDLTEVFQRGQAERKIKSADELTAPLYEEIGRLKMEIDWFISSSSNNARPPKMTRPYSP